MPMHFAPLADIHQILDSISHDIPWFVSKDLHFPTYYNIFQHIPTYIGIFQPFMAQKNDMETTGFVSQEATSASEGSKGSRSQVLEKGGVMNSTRFTLGIHIGSPVFFDF